MPRGQRMHDVPREGKRALERQGAPSKTFGTQAKAIDAGRRLAQRQETELLVHGSTGRNRMRNFHGHYPRRTKG